MPDPDSLDDVRRDDEQINRRDFPDRTVLADLRDYGDLGGRS
jgi:hypothetical protein